MKRSLVPIIVVVVAIVAFFGWDDVATWMGVMKDDVARKIDVALGKYEVEAKRVERRINDLATRLNEIETQHLTTEHRLKRIDEKLQPYNRAVAILTDLEKAKATNTALVVADRTFVTAAEREQLDRDLRAYVKARATVAESWKLSQNALQVSATTLKGWSENGTAQLASYRAEFSAVSEKIKAIEVLQQTASLTSAAPDSIGTDFARLELEMDQLLGGVDGRLAQLQTELQTLPTMMADSELERILTSPASEAPQQLNTLLAGTTPTS